MMGINTKQLDLLRQLCRQREPCLVDHLDGRVVRALENRGFVRTHGGWASATDEGRAELRKQQDSPVRPKRRRTGKGGATGRVEMILRAVSQLEHLIPGHLEIDLGRFPAYADDVFASLRTFARDMAES